MQRWLLLQSLIALTKSYSYNQCVNKYIKLSRSFYERDALTVARVLLGKTLVRRLGAAELSGIVVETEAYTQNDPACHASRGMTKRNKTLFGEPGYAYIYFTYGMHYCLNAVTGPIGRAEGVLLRAIKPIVGLDVMKHNRGVGEVRSLCSGPGKLTQALGIDARMDRTDLLGNELYILDSNEERTDIVATTRVGIKIATDFPWRFYLAGESEWVSRR